jgi:hypothetical protein
MNIFDHLFFSGFAAIIITLGAEVLFSLGDDEISQSWSEMSKEIINGWFFALVMNMISDHYFSIIVPITLLFTGMLAVMVLKGFISFVLYLRGKSVSNT